MTAAAVKAGRRFAWCPVVAVSTAALIALLLAGGCSRGDAEATYKPRVLRVVLIPDRPPNDLERDFQPLLDYVAAQTGLTIELLHVEHYDEALDMFGSRRADLIRFGGFTYVLANQRYDARALVTRDIDLRFRSVIIARADLAADGLGSLRGRTMNFGPRYSTSGHVMPRAFLQEQGIIPEDFFSEVGYANNHVDSIRAVAEGEIDAAAVNSLILERAIRRHEEFTKSLKLVWTSPRYANYVWATQSDLDPAVRDSIREAFLALTMLDENHQQILSRVGAAGFLPAQQKNYELLLAYVRDYGPDPQ